MARYILLRLIGIVAVLWFIGTITFFLMHAVPGGPWDEDKQSLPPEVKQNILHKYGLDRPLLEQYTVYWTNLLQGDLGIPYQAPTETVVSLIGQSWPASVQLGLMSLVLAFAVGVSDLVLETPRPFEQSSGIVTFHIRGLESGKLIASLLEHERILASPVDALEFGAPGVRISTHVFNTSEEIDRLIAGLERVQRHGY